MTLEVYTFTCTISDYTFFLNTKGLPDFYHEFYRSHAYLVDEKDLDLPERDPDGSDHCFLAVQKKGQQDYLLVVALGHEYIEPVFVPGMLFVEETETLYLGAGELVLVYGLHPPIKKAEQEADMGFLGWDRVQDVVIMNAEMGIAVWDLAGNQLWSQIVEPPTNMLLMLAIWI